MSGINEYLASLITGSVLLKACGEQDQQKEYCSVSE
jgi:hypothetical protein